MVRHMNEENIEAKQPRKRKFTKDRLVPGLVLTLALSFLLGLYAPLELYFTNITEFQFDLWTLAAAAAGAVWDLFLGRDRGLWPVLADSRQAV